MDYSSNLTYSANNTINIFYILSLDFNAPTMDRRKFIRTTAMAATLVGISPSILANNDGLKGKKKIIFVFRGVGYNDAFNAFKKFNISTNLSFHIQKTDCTNNSFTHSEGMENIIKGLSGKKTINQTQLFDRCSISQVVEGAFNNTLKETQVFWMHHTEIGHSSNKIYTENLEEFFSELSKHYNSALHKIVVTADIGRNETLNSCGGKDHSNSTCLETFALYIGGNASKLTSKNISLNQPNILKQKF